MSLKHSHFIGIICIIFLLGFLARGGISSSLDKKLSRANKTTNDSSGSSTSQEKNIEGNIHPGKRRRTLTNPGKGPSNYVTTPYSAENPFERLEALENATYEVPGYAFSRLVPEVFDEQHHISPSMAYIMELTDEEEQKFNTFLDETVNQIRNIEREKVSIKTGRDGVETIIISSFKDQGNDFRADLLNHIEDDLGHERRQIFEMITINQPSTFANYGQESIVLKNPQVELLNGHREIVTLEVGTILDEGTGNERFEGGEVTLTPNAFRKRYGHLYELDGLSK